MGVRFLFPVGVLGRAFTDLTSHLMDFSHQDLAQLFTCLFFKGFSFVSFRKQSELSAFRSDPFGPVYCVPRQQQDESAEAGSSHRARSGAAPMFAVLLLSCELSVERSVCFFWPLGFKQKRKKEWLGLTLKNCGIRLSYSRV